MKEWIKQHPYATGGIVLFVGVLFLLLRKGGSSASSSASSSLGAAAQIAQIQAAAGAQNATVNAQVSAAQINANAQMQAQRDALTAQQDTIIGQVAEYGLNYKASIATTAAQTRGQELQASIYKDLIDTAARETDSNNALQAAALRYKYDAVGKAVDLTKQGGRGNIGANELALILNQGDISSFNNANASTSIASSISTASILKSITGVATGVLGGLF